MILTVTPNPCVDKTLFLETLQPGASHRKTRCTTIPGGKGTNVSRAVRAMGNETVAMVLVGGHTGDHVVRMIEEDDGVPVIPVRVTSPTRTITTILEESIHRQTPLFEPGPVVTPAEYQALKRIFEAALSRATVVTLNGTVPDSARSALYAELIPVARRADVPVLLDSHGPEFAQGIEQKPFMVKPNAAEAAEYLGYPLADRDAQLRAVGDFHERGIELVAISLGADGALVSNGSERLLVTPPSIQEVNAVGSGDAFLAMFAIGIAAGRESLESMARQAVAAGAANAQSWSIGHFTREEVAALAPRVSVQSL